MLIASTSRNSILLFNCDRDTARGRSPTSKGHEGGCTASAGLGRHEFHVDGAWRCHDIHSAAVGTGTPELLLFFLWHSRFWKKNSSNKAVSRAESTCASISPINLNSFMSLNDMWFWHPNSMIQHDPTTHKGFRWSWDIYPLNPEPLHPMSMAVPARNCGQWPARRARRVMFHAMCPAQSAKLAPVPGQGYGTNNCCNCQWEKLAKEKHN